MNKAFFLDRDGTIIVDKHYLAKPEEVELLPGAAKAIRMMNENGYKVIVVSKQSGVARGYFAIDDVDKVNVRLNDVLEQSGAHIDAFYICPHHPDGIVFPYNVICECRKPGTLLFEKAAEEYNIDMTASAAVGDRKRDVQNLSQLGVKHLGVIGTEDGEYSSLLSFTKDIIR